jgi:phage portal protein BeeE
MSILDRFFKLDKRNDVLRLFDKFGTNQDNLIQHSYEKNVDAFAVVKKIADIFAASPWIVEQKVDGEWQVAEDNSLQELLDNPNSLKGYTWNDIDEQMITYLLCSGNSYLHGETRLMYCRVIILTLKPTIISFYLILDIVLR